MVIFDIILSANTKSAEPLHHIHCQASHLYFSFCSIASAAAISQLGQIEDSTEQPASIPNPSCTDLKPHLQQRLKKSPRCQNHAIFKCHSPWLIRCCLKTPRSPHCDSDAVQPPCQRHGCLHRAFPNVATIASLLTLVRGMLLPKRHRCHRVQSR